MFDVQEERIGIIIAKQEKSLEKENLSYFGPCLLALKVPLVLHALSPEDVKCLLQFADLLRMPRAVGKQKLISILCQFRLLAYLLPELLVYFLQGGFTLHIFLPLLLECDFHGFQVLQKLPTFLLVLVYDVLPQACDLKPLLIKL